MIHNIKSILGIGTVAGVLTFASCADMLAPESDLVMYEEDNQLSSANDTVYSVMGVIHLMQQVADRTNLLGEVRGDLVKVTDFATIDLQALSAFEADTLNSYNHPEDFYAIVNNCNYFIQHADTAIRRQGKQVFERELAVMHTYRAWAYLQLVTTYGEIPFYTDFLGTQEAASEVMRRPKMGIQEVCSFLIDDLLPWIDTYELDYGNVGKYNSTMYTIPVRLMLGELCLWSDRNLEAAQYYHDFLNNRDGYHPIGIYSVSWMTDARPATGISSSYNITFSNDNITIIPMEANTFEGTISYLDDVYEATSDNDYYYQLTWSPALVNLSAAQKYYYVYNNRETNEKDTVCMSVDSLIVKETDSKCIGDLRIQAVCSERAAHNSLNDKRNDTYQSISKIQSDFVSLYRLPQVYLHYAEALNQAGFPSAAFAVLKYGICQRNLERTEGNPIAQWERDNAGDLISFDQYAFLPSNTIGIHARGCGDADANPEYVLPQPTDSLPSYQDTIQFLQPYVEELIMDELALETCFEGQRFYDLVRTALRRNDPAYLADRVANREGVMDDALRAKLMTPANWYLPLRKAQ